MRLNICSVALFSAAAMAAADIRNHRHLQDDLPLVQARYLIAFLWVESPFAVDLEYEIAPVEIICSGNAQAVLLEDENLDWNQCRSASASTLICENFRKEAVAFGLTTYVAMACVGTDPHDLYTVSASMLETPFSAGPSSSLSRLIEIQALCEPPDLETGELRSSSYFPVPYPIADTSCSPEVDLLVGSCNFVADCYRLTGAFFVGCSETLPRVTASATQDPIPAVTECLYANDPAVLPTMGGTVSYRVGVGYQENGCLSGDHSVTVTCENGGTLEILAVGEEADFNRLDASSVSFPMPTNTESLIIGETDISCSGSSLKQLAVTATWNPGPLSCEGLLVSNILRVLDVYQLCPEKALLLNNLLGPFADNNALTCFPQTSSFVEAISATEVETENNVVIATHNIDVTTFSSCNDSPGGACAPNCDATDISRLVSTVKPEHIALDCVDDEGAGGVGDNADNADGVEGAGGMDNDAGGEGAGGTDNDTGGDDNEETGGTDDKPDGDEVPGEEGLTTANNDAGNDGATNEATVFVADNTANNNVPSASTSRKKKASSFGSFLAACGSSLFVIL